MTPCWRRRRGEGAQAALETALVMPIMFALTLGFIGMMLQLRAECEFQSAVNLASQAAVQPRSGIRMTASPTPGTPSPTP